MSNISKLRKLDLLFEFVKQAVLGEGGDGYGYIVSEDPVFLSNIFEENEDWFKEKSVYKDMIAFSNNQEAIYFVYPDHPVQWADIVVEIKY